MKLDKTTCTLNSQEINVKRKRVHCAGTLAQCETMRSLELQRLSKIQARAWQRIARDLGPDIKPD